VKPFGSRLLEAAACDQPRRNLTRQPSCNDESVITNQPEKKLFALLLELLVVKALKASNVVFVTVCINEWISAGFIHSRRLLLQIKETRVWPQEDVARQRPQCLK